MFTHEEDYIEEVVSAKENELNEKGYSFITNFQVKKEVLYKKASELHKLKYIIENETYDLFGNKIGNGTFSKAFYVESAIGDLTDFWRTFDQLKLELGL